jgi:YVTN family beta-propeller protein
MRAAFLTLLLSLIHAQTLEQPVRAPIDPGVVTTRQTITPAGVPSVFKGRVYGVAFGPQPSTLWVLHATHIYQFDWKENRVVSMTAHGGTPGLQAIAQQAGADSPVIAVAQATKGKPPRVMLARGEGKPFTEPLGSHLAGALSLGGGRAVVPLTFDNQLGVVDLATGRVLGKVRTGIAPFGAVVNRAGTVAYVSNWGGRVPRASDLVAPTGVAPTADRVVVDNRGIASTGTVTRVDLATLNATHTIPAQLHPTAVAWDETRNRLYVANSNSDTITVIDTHSNAPAATIALQPFAQRAAGIAPTALALTSDGRTLFAACGGINAVAQIDALSGRIQGLIPTAWYPNGLALSSDGKHLAVSALLGAGSGWRDEPRKRFVHSYRGSVAVIDLPDAAQLAAYTTAVAENTRMPLTAVPAPPAAPARAKAVPARSGDPSLIEHVVYIVKENRTYDQVFGDVAKGNGDPSLTMFGREVTPNHHRLADQFVLLDNFHATGGNSADGHQWLTQANETAYCLWPGYQGRSYPYDGTDPIAPSASGFLWDYALARGRSTRLYGEFAGSLPEPGKQRLELMRQFEQGKDFTAFWNITAPNASVNRILAHNYPPYSNAIPDVVRASIFLADLKRWESEGKMPNLTILLLPCDHTFGTSPGLSSPRAMLADNDLALGRMVEALTKSKFWKKMAIMIVEDDAQNGVDHVDGHRTVALAVSPYTRRGHVDSTFYSHQSMLKTIELMLGLPTMSLFDLIASDMRASFTDQPDVTPYEHAAATWDLYETNPPLNTLRGPARRGAIESARMRWDVPDAAPTEKLNRILWHSVKGWNTPYPGTRQAVFSPLSLDVDDDDR